MKRGAVLLILVMIIAILAGCDNSKVDRIGLKELGIDKTKGQLVEYTDTHGSMGDGSTYIEIEFAGKHAEDVEKNIRDKSFWIPMPLSVNLQKAVYGDGELRSLLQSSEQIPLIPTVTDGYYYFNDRHSGSKDSTDDTELLERYSFNFDILIYDMEEHKLYIFQFDT